jgi:hypothetical protein
MKNLFMSSGLALGIGLCVPQLAQAQGTTTYLTSIGTSLTTEPVASDSWVAATFQAGDNPGGYVLDSIQLEMANTAGNPTDFTVQLYGLPSNGNPDPGSSLATLSGLSNPTSAGLYAYDASGVTLSPDTQYFIVVTSSTPVSSGFYEWGQENPSSNVSAGNGWTEGAVTFGSSDGSSWNESYSNDPQFALTATAVPEPDTLGLMGLSGLLFFAWRRWQAKTQTPIAIGNG